MLDGDIKFWAPESTLPDATQGGRKTSTLIVSGQVGNLVAPIADADTVTGSVMGYKFYVGVDLPDLSIYYKPWLFIARPPVAGNVRVCLIDTRSWFDRWDEARERLERYLARGQKWPGRLLETQLDGQRSIQIYQRLGAPLPAVGEVYALVGDEGKSTEFEQFVRATQVAQEVRTFTIAGKDIIRNVVTLTLSEPLEYLFDGGTITDDDAVIPPAALRTTLVANATMEYGIAALIEAAAIGDIAIRIPTIFHQLVPAATQEVALTDIDAAGQSVTLVPADQGLVTFGTSMPWTAGTSLYLGSPCQPGTLTVTLGATTLTDNAAGVLKAGTTAVGTLNYAEGILTLAAGSPAYSGAKTVTFRPAAAPVLHVQSASIGVDISNRGYVYVLNLSPIPAPGTLAVAYRAQGRWYEVEEQGDGTLRGLDSSYGAGTLSFVTGTVSVTLGAYPDPGSEIIYQWSVPVWILNRAGTAVPRPYFVLQPSGQGMAPGSLVITWHDGIAARTATDDGAGNLTGDASGTVVDYAHPLIHLAPLVTPPVGTLFHVEFDSGTPLTYTATAPIVDGSGFVDITLPDTAIIPGSLRASWGVSWNNGISQLTGGVTAIDDGAGKFVGFPSSVLTYATGQCRFKPGVE